MHLITLTVGAIQSNCYLLWGEDREALVVDPGAEAERILQAINERDLTVAAILLTHGHYDHIGALVEVHRAHPAPVSLHPADARWAFTEINQMPPLYPAVKDPPPIAHAFEDGETRTQAGLTYRVIATPGHSPGGVCLWFEEDQVLISGDTLFRGSIGRTDLPGSEPQVMAASLELIQTLPRETEVYPGHGPSTTIGFEKENNPFLNGAKFAE